MRWFKPNLRSSLFALFASSQPTASTPSAPPVSVEDIRSAMLELAGNLENTRYAHVGRRIRCALDAEGLWYLRSDLMAILAGRHGEAQAREKLQDVTDLFEYLLPQGLKSRPSPLAMASRSDPGEPWRTDAPGVPGDGALPV